jgi:hypothetical protein
MTILSKVAVTAASTLVVIILAAALWVMVFKPRPSLEEIAAPCRGHGGVQEYVPNSFNWSRPLSGHAGLAVCRDGKVGWVK